MIYYKITTEQAELIGEFSYKGINFSPFVRQQTDGLFLVAQDIYNRLKNSANFKKIDWTKVPTTETFSDLLPENLL